MFYHIIHHHYLRRHRLEQTNDQGSFNLATQRWMLTYPPSCPRHHRYHHRHRRQHHHRNLHMIMVRRIWKVERLLSLSSRPIPSIRLKPRPTSLNADMMIEKDTKLSIKIEDILSLPFSFSNASSPTSSEFGNIESIQALPSLSVSKNSSSSSDSSPVKSKSESSPLGANEKKDKTTADNDIEDGQQGEVARFPED